MSSEEKKVFEEEDLILSDNHPQEPYRRRKDEEKKSIAYGQRKLLLTLLYFITYIVNKFKREKYIIVYAGAAPGNNIQIIADLFKDKANIEWHLYDPAPFKIQTNWNNRFFVYQKKFDEDTAKYWKSVNEFTDSVSDSVNDDVNDSVNNKNVFFISDIRTADYTQTNNLEENEEQIMGDMQLQREWVEMIRPIASLLKFRLPYAIPGMPEEIKYLDGVLYKQPYAPQTSTECRLLVSSVKLTYKNYNCKKYESQMFYHNVIIREHKKYINECKGTDDELIDDYDSSAEVYILGLICKSNKEICELSRMITDKLSIGKKTKDTLKYLRDNPQTIKKRNFHR